MKKMLYILGLLSALLFLAFGTALVSDEKVAFELLTKTSSFQAGEPIQLEFSSQSKTEKPALFLIHSYGKTLVEATLENGKYRFKIPMHYGRKTGVVSWFLINGSYKINSGTFEIIPNSKTKTQIENYLGPRSILAGGQEFTMMVTVPTDGFDNPVADNSKAIIKHQFLNTITETPETTKNFIAWKNIFSESKSGKLLVSTECNATASKEIETDVYPNIATNFSINYSRNHDFADGNQITTFTTSSIKDAFGNVVSDGTLVTFIITTKTKMLLKTFGTTINGIANAQLLHPDHAETYSVKGYVTGIAESNAITLAYKPMMQSFGYSFSNNNRKLVVGPLKSFMNQLVPDGIRVTVKVFHGTTLVTTLHEESSKGNATFKLSSDFYKEKEYRFEISTLGVTQTTETKHYDIN